MFTSIANFAGRHPVAYMSGCFAVGLIIRWYWVGQDIHRFVDPLAPLFR